MTIEDDEKRVSPQPEVSESEGEVIFGPGMDGMGTFTAKLAIDRKLRKELLENYDLMRSSTKEGITPQRLTVKMVADFMNY